MKKGLLWLFFGWTIIVISMATIDAFSPSESFRVASWLTLFFMGTVLTVWSLILHPIKHNEAEKIALACTGFLAGLFLSVYNITWQIGLLFKGSINVLPVPLSPFPFIAYAPEWYGMIALGLFFIFLSLYFLEKDRFQ